MKKIIKIIGYIFGGLFILGILAAIFEKPKTMTNQQEQQQISEVKTTKINNDNDFINNGLKLFIASLFYDGKKNIGDFISFDKIYSDKNIKNDYSQNEIKADKTYLNKRINITGKIENIRRDALDNRSIVFSTGGIATISSSKYGDTYYNKLKNKDIPYLDFLAKLKKGQNVLLSCNVSGLVIGIVAYSDCVPAFAALPYSDYYEQIKTNKDNKNSDAIILYLLNKKVKNCNIKNVNDWDSITEEQKENASCFEMNESDNYLKEEYKKIMY